MSNLIGVTEVDVDLKIFTRALSPRFVNPKQAMAPYIFAKCIMFLYTDYCTTNCPNPNGANANLSAKK